MPTKPTFSKVPGDGKDRITQRTELTQAFGSDGTAQTVKNRPTSTLVAASAPAANPGTETGIVTLRMPVGFTTNGSTGAAKGKSFSVLVSALGMVKGYRGGLVAGIPYRDFEPGLGYPIGNAYKLLSDTNGRRYWWPDTSGSGGGVVTVPDGILKGVSGSFSAAVAQLDYESWLGNPAGGGYVLRSNPDGFRFWAPPYVGQGNYEPFLGYPAGNGYVLSSTVSGTRSWIPPASGSGGGSSQMPWFPAITSPPSSGWSWLNQDGASLNSGTGYEGVEEAATGIGSLLGMRCRMRSYPSAPFTLTMACQFLCPANAFGIGFGFMIRDPVAATPAAKFLGWFLNAVGDWRFKTQLYNAALTSTSGASTDLWIPGDLYSGGIAWLIWIRYRDDNTNRYVDVSADGLIWEELLSEARTTSFTPSEIGFAMKAPNSAVGNMGKGVLTVVHWAVT